ncbi:DegT/DnrJ/EryC1/StrS family aminotransferase [Sphingomonas sp.]|jgi:dTDP-4-amino-4,6-dideoxygalactose transaminase|uniref:DegT/DnrJ/EryC1/StrS family aminotransferase n=1 Tax=Sphingomonas sp. TaxID=28214 RepID=UPI00260D7412|nr:DegT/DnrJ/EryC1/StrS family aminotransferase [Sphingomonas sp.]MDF2496165.1 putative pyridoxal-phosphate-dependent/PLP-dependent aminotransferase [Sphingomonas sp.]
MTPVPLFDCRLPDSALATLADPFRLGQLAAGPAVGQLEQAIAARYPGRHAVSVGDMTHALVMALRLAGVRRGDEVLSLAFNCMSSNSAIAMAGATVAWVDVDPATATFDIDQARGRITARTKAVVAYHVSGYPADLAALRALCDEYGLPLIEDANNAFGAAIDGHEVGMVGDFAIFSLYANRQINAIDGGIVLCAHAEDADQARRLRRFGIDTARFRDGDGEIDPALDVPEIGTSSSLDNVRATIALASIADVDARIARSRRNAASLAGVTRDLPLTPITALPGAEPVHWTWLIRLADRDAVMRRLKARGVLCSKLHYPNHHYTGFHAPPSDLPGTMTLQNEMLAIPCGWWLDEAAIATLAATIAETVRADP